MTNKYKAEKLPFRLFCNTCDGIYRIPGIDVYFGTVCVNKCDFCLVRYSKSLNESIMPWNQKPDVDKILASVNKLCSAYNKRHMQILGGEPLLFLEQLNGFLDKIPSGVNFIKLQTSLPKACLVKKDLLLNVLSKVNVVEVSIHHPDNKINAKVLRSNEDQDRLELLGQLKKELPDLKVMTNTVITKDIFKKGDIELLIEKAHKNHVDCMRLTEVKECQAKYIPITDLLPVKYNAPYSHGCSIPLHVDGIQDMKILIRPNCFRCNSQLMASNLDLIKAITKKFDWIRTHQCVRDYGVGIFPNGEIYNQ